MNNTIVTHPEPVWRDRADFIIAAPIADADTGKPQREQLWARQVEESIFEICCVPFFLYDVALGDKVMVEHNDAYLLKSVVERSGRYVFRAWLGEDANREEIIASIVDLGCLVESRGPTSRLLAIDAASDAHAKECADRLQALENSGVLQYETGRI